MNEHIFHPLTIGIAHLCLLTLLIFSTYLTDRLALTFCIIDSSSHANWQAHRFNFRGALEGWVLIASN